MTRSFPMSLTVALTALCIVLASCGDDENPVAVDSPCDDAGTTCMTVTLDTAEMTSSAYYDAVFDETSHSLSWDVASLATLDYAPGQRILLTVVFNPPLEVRYDHPYHNFSVGAGVAGGVFDRWTISTPSLTSDDWAVLVTTTEYSGQSTGASRFSLSATLGPLVVGQRLSRLAFDLVVPETYTSGGSSGTPVLPGDLAIFGIGVSTSTDGDTTSEPPVWQGAYEPTANRR